MESVKISVITTVKNGELYILDTLNSVKGQSFTSFEHVLIDDGSTDQTVPLILDFKKKNPHYNLILFKKGQIGRGKALSLAVSKSKGKWLAILDADDIWHPRKLELQNKIIEENKIDVLATETKLFYKNNELMFDIEEYMAGKLQINYYSLKDFLRSNVFSHSSVLIRKELCRYDENRKSQFDYDLWFRLMKKRYVFAKIKTPLSYHRIHQNQSFESKMKKAYRIRSYKLKAINCIESKDFSSLLYNTVKLFFDLVLPRKARLWIKNKI